MDNRIRSLDTKGLILVGWIENRKHVLKNGRYINKSRLCIPQQRHDKIGVRCKIKVLCFEGQSKAKSIKKEREGVKIIQRWIIIALIVSESLWQKWDDLYTLLEFTF